MYFGPGDFVSGIIRIVMWLLAHSYSWIGMECYSLLSVVHRMGRCKSVLLIERVPIMAGTQITNLSCTFGFLPAR